MNNENEMYVLVTVMPKLNNEENYEKVSETIRAIDMNFKDHYISIPYNSTISYPRGTFSCELPDEVYSVARSKVKNIVTERLKENKIEATVLVLAAKYAAQIVEVIELS